MYKKTTMAIFLLASSFIAPMHLNAYASPCEAAGTTIGAVATLVTFAKEFRKTMRGQSDFHGLNGLCSALAETVVGPIFFQLGQMTARTADNLIKNSAFVAYNNRISTSQKISSFAINSAGLCCLIPLSLALHTVGGFVIGQGLGHIAGEVTKPVAKIVNDTFDF